MFFFRIRRTVHQIARAAIGTKAAVTILGSIIIRPLSWAALTRYPLYPHLQLTAWQHSACANRLGFGEIAMQDWKADLDRLVEETMAFAKSIHIEPTMPRTIVEPKRTPSLNWRKSEREEIEYRVANFKAHQQRFIREREDYAASELKRMQASRH